MNASHQQSTQLHANPDQTETQLVTSLRLIASPFERTFSERYRVVLHAGSLERKEEVEELLESIAESNSSRTFLKELRHDILSHFFDGLNYG